MSVHVPPDRSYVLPSITTVAVAFPWPPGACVAPPLLAGVSLVDVELPQPTTAAARRNVTQNLRIGVLS
jgi:hypothetical protein